MEMASRYAMNGKLNKPAISLINKRTIRIIKLILIKNVVIQNLK